MTAVAALEQDPSYRRMERDPVGFGVLGRFISRDPIGHAGNLNLYAYPTNPVNAVDPSGLDNYVTSSDGGDLTFIAHLLTLGSGIPIEVGGKGFVRSSNLATIATACTSPYQTSEGKTLVQRLLDPKAVQVDGLVSGGPMYRSLPKNVRLEFTVGASMYGLNMKEHGFISSGIKKLYEQNPFIGIAAVFHEFEEARVECGSADPTSKEVFDKAHEAGLNIENAILGRLLGLRRTREDGTKGEAYYTFPDGSLGLTVNLPNLTVK